MKRLCIDFDATPDQLEHLAALVDHFLEPVADWTAIRVHEWWVDDLESHTIWVDYDPKEPS
jgi:hypothetical protein